MRPSASAFFSGQAISPHATSQLPLHRVGSHTSWVSGDSGQSNARYCLPAGGVPHSKFLDNRLCHTAAGSRHHPETHGLRHLVPTRRATAPTALLNRGFRPGALRRYSPWMPAAAAFLNHWLTAPRVTPNASAMRTGFQPCFFNAHARNRRASGQSSGCLFIMPSVYHTNHQKFRKLFSCQ